MSSMDKTDLADRMKEYERTLVPYKIFNGQPIIARLDGRSFHNFTKGLKRPFDNDLHSLMVETVKALFKEFQPRVAYTQSDEITLIWYNECGAQTQYPFDGKTQKLNSSLAAFGSATFNKLLASYLPNKANVLATFDCRIHTVPNLSEAINNLIWRQQDATKNAISMAAQSMFSHSELQGKHGPEMQEMMFSVHGVNFNDYQYSFKRGTFVRRFSEERMFTAQEIIDKKIPFEHIPKVPVIRSVIKQFDLWLAKSENRISDLFGDGGFN